MTWKRAALSLSVSLLLTLLLLQLPVPETQAAEKVYGGGVTLASSTPIASILAEPAAWKGKRVRVEGKVRGVCAKRGCWMELRSPAGDALRIEVEDGVIVFPESAVGGWARAEGVVELHQLSREQYTSWKAHEAEELGRDFDPASVGDGPYTLVQVAGSGAVVEQG